MVTRTRLQHHLPSRVPVILVASPNGCAVNGQAVLCLDPVVGERLAWNWAIETRYQYVLPGEIVDITRSHPFLELLFAIEVAITPIIVTGLLQ